MVREYLDCIYCLLTQKKIGFEHRLHSLHLILNYVFPLIHDHLTCCIRS